MTGGLTVVRERFSFFLSPAYLSDVFRPPIRPPGCLATGLLRPATR